MVFKLPEEKVLRADKAVKDVLPKRWASYKSMERLTGYLAHCSTLIKGGRTFCRRLYELLKVTKGRRRIKLPGTIKLDLQWWSSFLRVFNGRCPITRLGQPDCEVYTDASTLGLGVGRVRTTFMVTGMRFRLGVLTMSNHQC